MRTTHGSNAAPIGVFDSGIGGLSVLQAVRAEMPGEDYVYLADNGHAPYGERGDDFVAARTLAVAGTMRERHGVKALVVACNTATAAAIHLLRTAHPDLPVIGVEPAVKPAIALSRTRRIGVIGTRGTVSSAKFRALLAPLRAQADYVVQACDGLALAIERSGASEEDTAGITGEIEALCARYTGAMGRFGDGPDCIDTLVLGCTHYVFAADVLRSLVGPHVRFIDTGEPVARQTRRLLELRGALRDGAANAPGQVALYSTGDLRFLQSAARRWLHLPALSPALQAS